MAVAVQPLMVDVIKKKPPTNHRRVVVTGMGVETSMGHDPDVFYNNLLEGVRGISEIEGFDCFNYPTELTESRTELISRIRSFKLVNSQKLVNFKNRSTVAASEHLFSISDSRSSLPSISSPRFMLNAEDMIGRLYNIWAFQFK
ncbi:uncharacterized protein LOC141684863 [Apium graveolens]|uniref:uncharacterized protein LOC141684863 n=1 Tax=Apium graveolens TaxID=4045 RepID=UPI003D7987E9